MPEAVLGLLKTFDAKLFPGTGKKLAQMLNSSELSKSVTKRNDADVLLKEEKAQFLLN